MASVKTVATVIAEKRRKYEINRGRRDYISKQTSASREPVASYSYLESKEPLKVPEELPVPKRVVDEEGEAEEEKRNNFCGSIQEDKKTSVNTELQDSERTSWLNPDAAEFVPVLFVRDPDPVTSSSSTQGYEKSLDGVALPSPVEINLVIAHEPGQLDSRVENVEDVVVAQSGEGEESKEESEERSVDAAQGSIVIGVSQTEESEFADGHGDVQGASVSAVSYTHLDVYKRQILVCVRVYQFSIWALMQIKD